MTETNDSNLTKLIQVFQKAQLKSIWFLGNLLTFIGGIIYFLTYFQTNHSIINLIGYKLIFLGAIDTFTIVIYQQQYSNSSTLLNLKSLLQNDNVHYLYNSIIWLLIPFKITTLSTIPFLSFSIFHILSFLTGEILPIFGFDSLNLKLKSFINNHHDFSRSSSASSELILLGYLILNSIFWVKYSWSLLALYFIFIKIKSEGSIFTRTELKNWEVRIDGIVSSQSIPSIVKIQWNNLKKFIKSLNNFNIIDKTTSNYQSKPQN